MKRQELIDRTNRLYHQAVTYDQLEQLAGITDRQSFWFDKTEEQGREELRRLILEKVKSGKFT